MLLREHKFCPRLFNPKKRWMVDLCEDAEVVVDLAERLHQRQATKDK